jgi:hypothetical protein
MESHPKAGCLGVKMIDGSGNFLPESKRSLPTPLVSFYKIFGLSALFPKSKIFGRYHLGYLDKNEVHKVDILPGAFMFIRKSVLDEVGLMDESFFMYGEDIDISYRIILAGYENYYFPETTIIHYKGESTKKGSINYVMVFYKAMIIFAQKHFSPEHARLYSLLINTAVYLRASVSVLRRIFLAMIIPLADITMMFAGFYFLKPFWEHFKFGIEGYYPKEYMIFAVPSYILIWIVSLYLSGGYEKRTRPIDIFRGLSLGTIVLFLIYSMLPESIRYSRAIILFGTLWALITIFFTRLSLGYIFKNVQINFSRRKKRIVIAGSPQESKRVISILKQVDIEPSLIGLVGWHGQKRSKDYMGDLSQIDEIIKINRIDEIVFCAKDIPSQLIMQTMLDLGDTSVEFKIAPPESLSIIGSNSINTAGELYVIHFNALSQKIVRRRKRLFDALFSLLLFIFLPLNVFLVDKPVGFLRNIFLVFFGLRTWVGFYKPEGEGRGSLPEIPPGILSLVSFHEKRFINKETIERLNLLYAKDYRIINDLSIIMKNFHYLGK